MGLKEIYQKRRLEKQARKAAEKEAFRVRKQAETIENLKKTTRKPLEIQANFDQLVSVAGEKQYRAEVYKAEIQQINQQLAKLSNEYSQAVPVWGDPKAPKPAAEAIPAPGAPDGTTPAETTPETRSETAASTEEKVETSH